MIVPGSLPSVVSPGAILQISGSAVFVVLFGLFVAVSLVVLLGGLLELRMAWTIWRNDPDAVLDAPNGGRIELEGRADSDETVLTSPFTGTECLAYEFEVEQERNSDNGRRWKTIATGQNAVPFRLIDDTGSVLVEPTGADIRLSRESRLTVSGGEEPPARIARFIEDDERVDDQNRSIDLKLIELPVGSTQRFIEKRLDLGEEVHVLGTARFDTTVSRKTGQVNAVVGIDPAVLEYGRIRRLFHRHLGLPFLISDTDERGTVKRIALKGMVLFVTGWLMLYVLSLFMT